MLIDLRSRSHDTRKARAVSAAPRPSVPAHDGAGLDELVATPRAPSRPQVEVGEVQRIRLGSTIRVAVGFALTSLVVWLGAVGLVWLAASAGGLTGDVEGLVRDLGVEGFRLDSSPVLLAIGVLGVAWVVAVTTVACFAAVVYNAFATWWGGLTVEMRFADAAPSPDRS